MNYSISVCIPTYNQAHYLAKAINSAANQTLKPFEIIVSNDCSTDNTAAVLKKLSSEISELKIINQSYNLGMAKNADACLRAATGDYIVSLDSDDYLESNYCQILSDLLQQHPEAGYAHANVQEIDQFGNQTKQRILYRNIILQNANEALKAALKGYRVAANIIMFRKTALQDVQYITGRPNYTKDFHIAADLAAHGWGNVFSNQILAYYRVWLDAGKARMKRKLDEITGVTRVFEEILEPAFVKNHWNIKKISYSQKQFACKLSDCLSWNVYTKEEKQELITAIKKLSSSKKTLFYIWIYSNGFYVLINGMSICQKRLKQLAKKILLSFRKRSFS